MINDRDKVTLDPQEIDPATGLPRLPEGDRWFVSKRFPGIFSTTDKIFITDKTFITVTWQSLYVVEHKRWWGLAKPTVHSEWVEVIRSSFDLDEGVTKENILMTATDAVEAYNLKIEDKKLLGAYPPKNLQKETA